MARQPVPTRYEELCAKQAWTDQELAEWIEMLASAIDALTPLGARYRMVTDDLHANLRPIEEMQRMRREK